MRKINQNFVPAKTMSVEGKGYGKASCNASQMWKFMKIWLVVGGVSVAIEKLCFKNAQ
jgi:hypothetical protein